MAYDKAFAYLKEKGYEDRVHVFREGETATCALAAAALGVTEGEICKSMGFRGPDDSKAFLVLAAGDMKINSGKFKRTLGVKASMLSPEATERFTNHQVGGVCPFGIGPDIEVYMDESLRKYEIVYPACGSDNTAVKLTIPELEKLSGSRGWIDVTVPRNE
ncbi:MAG: YbaK/EbsC family protein [Spirochaetales bacterium]|nr:YbaK/EbsC family protein [Candidatus Physcosoma equi]